MPDLTTISTALASIKTAAEIAKLIKDSNQSLEQAEFKLKLSDLVSSLADAKIEIATIQELLIEKDREIYQLKERIEVKESMFFEPPYYFSERNKVKDGPFCAQCYDSDGKLIRLINNGYGPGIWRCNTCQNTFSDQNYQ
ncbi:hypothetical protein [Salinisphaera sp. G21_0]|uniref:hypothetical protein n=1 Tax=Salinisphaera sp. G21_0 TaxID=2821094 RepID=UPI001ADC337B|nr:hypothetical protein [Salinisphaera sp. G21_0]MBO9484668.1 hypothetical protein [Salinisphaera sp. G21_0]